MMSPPLPVNELERLAVLRSLGVLDTLPEADFDDIARLASLMLDVPIAAISLVDADRQFFKAIVGLDARETSRDVSFCGHTILEPCDALVVPDARLDPRFADNPLVTGDPQIRFYAGMPLLTAEGYAVGALCGIDRVPREPTPRQIESLKLLSRIVVRQLESRNRNIELRNLLEELAAAETAVNASSREISLMLDATRNVAIYRIDAEGRIMTWNAGAERIYGASSELALGQSVSIFFSPEERWRTNVNELLSRALRDGSVAFEAVRRRPDGTDFIANVSITPIFDGERHIGFTKITRDITVEKNSRREVESQRRLLETFIRRTPAPVAMFDRNMRYLAVSDRWRLDYGLVDRPIIGRLHYDVFPEIGEEWKSVHRRCLAGESLKRDDEAFLRADGNAHRVSWEVVPWFEQDGSIGGIIIFTSVQSIEAPLAEAGLQPALGEPRLAVAA